MPCWHCQRPPPSSGKSRFDQPPAATTTCGARYAAAPARTSTPSPDRLEPRFLLGDDLDAVPLADRAQRRDAVGGAQKSRLDLEQRALAPAELGELAAQVGRLEPAHLGAALSRVRVERGQVVVGGPVAHGEVADGEVELAPRLGLDAPPLRHGLDGQAAVVRVEVRRANLPRGPVRGRDRIRHRAPVDHERPPPPPRRLDGRAEPEHAAAYHDRDRTESWSSLPRCVGDLRRPLLAFAGRDELLGGDPNDLSISPDHEGYAGALVLEYCCFCCPPDCLVDWPAVRERAANTIRNATSHDWPPDAPAPREPRHG